MKHKKTLQTIIIASLIGALSSCASLSFLNKPTIDVNNSSYTYDTEPIAYSSRYEGRKKVINSILSIPEAIYECAGVAAESLEAIDKEYRGYSPGGHIVYEIDGSFNRIENPDMLEKILVETDTNFDYHITRDEAINTYDSMMKKSLDVYTERKILEAEQASEEEKKSNKFLGIF